MITQEDFFITQKVQFEIENNPELYQLNLSLFKDLSTNPLLNWIYITLDQYDHLCRMISIQERKQEFAVNSYYHLLHLITNYELTGLNSGSSLELAQNDIKDLFENYNNKELNL